MNITYDYYEKNTKEFFESTVNADVEYLYQDFLKYIPIDARILDLGCGSGRDSKYFKDKGYKVVSVDASPALCSMAKDNLGIDIICKRFDELHYKEEFNGIWACASLLHCNKRELKETIKIIERALIPGGVFYASFKYGDFEGEREGRFFLDLNENTAIDIFGKIDGLEIIKVWKSEDVRRDKDVSWINVLMIKECNNTNE